MGRAKTQDSRHPPPRWDGQDLWKEEKVAVPHSFHSDRQQRVYIIHAATPAARTTQSVDDYSDTWIYSLCAPSSRELIRGSEILTTHTNYIRCVEHFGWE